MIKETTTQEKPVFGKDFETKKKRVQKEKPLAQPVPEKLCAFQETKEKQGRLAYSEQCKEPALENGWCQEHKHAQAGMDEGERLGWRSVEVPMCAVYYEGSLHQFTLIIGPGRRDWLAYFEKASGTGFDTVMKYLQEQM